MEYFLGLLCIWLLVFGPLGLLIHAIALGSSARLQAAVVAPITGLALGILVLGAADLVGIKPGNSSLAGVLVAGAIAAALIVARSGGSWRTRGLVSAAVLLVLTMIAIHIPVFDTATSGPLGYGSHGAPLQQIATIDTLTGSPAASEPAVHRAAGDLAGRYLGFERLAAFTVGIGTSSSGSGSSWTAYTTHSIIVGVLASLITLPMLLLARWRRVGLIGTLGILIAGVVSPYVMVAMGTARGEMVAVVPFAVGTVAAVFLARRDPGWAAIAVIQGGAAFTIAGIPALLPAIGGGAIWWGLQRDLKEHLAHTDTPVDAWRPRAVIGVGLVLAAAAGATSVVGGLIPEWEPLHRTVRAALASWPATWIGPSMNVVVPSADQDLALMLLGATGVLLAVWVSTRLRQWRELALLAAPGLLLATALGMAVFDRSAAISMMELAWMIGSPILMLVIIRAVGQLRADGRDSAVRKYAFAGPLLIASLLVLFSAAASVTTGSRMVHGPSWSRDAGFSRDTLLTVADPWLDYLIRGDQVTAGQDVVDADLLTSNRNPFTHASTVYQRRNYIIVGASPFASDPPSGYVEQRNMIGASPVRVFRDEAQPNAAPASGTASSIGAANARPRKHTPVEQGFSQQQLGSVTGMSGRIGGLVIPGTEFDQCGVEHGTSCEVDAPARRGRCSAADVRQARSAIISRDATDAGTAFGSARKALPLIGVGCWQVELNDATRSIQIHVRDIGIVLPATSADASPADAWSQSLGASESPVLGGDWLRTTTADATASYGGGRIRGVYDMSVESQQLADLQLRVPGMSSMVTTTLQPGIAGWSRVLRSIIVPSDIVIRNSSGTQLQLGRVVLRPVSHDAACDMVLPATAHARQELVERATAGSTVDANDGKQSGDLVSLPAITAVVTGISRPASGRERIATIAVGSYMQTNGLPHQLMLDWTEQYASSRHQPACGGYTVQ